MYAYDLLLATAAEWGKGVAPLPSDEAKEEIMNRIKDAAAFYKLTITEMASRVLAKDAATAVAAAAAAAVAAAAVYRGGMWV